jgi:hypothetical protein
MLFVSSCCLSFVLLRTWYIVPHITCIRIHLCSSTLNLASLHRKHSHKIHIDIILFLFNCCLVLHPFVPPELSLYCYFTPFGGCMARKQHRQPVSTEVVYYFRNQNTVTFPEDHCCFFVASTASPPPSLPNRQYQCSSRRYQYSRYIVSFIVFLVQPCSPPSAKGHHPLLH